MMDPQVEEEYIRSLSDYLGIGWEETHKMIDPPMSVESANQDLDVPDFDQLVSSSRTKKREGENLADKKRARNRKKNALSRQARRINRKK